MQVHVHKLAKAEISEMSLRKMTRNKNLHAGQMCLVLMVVAFAEPSVHLNLQFHLRNQMKLS